MIVHTLLQQAKDFLFLRQRAYKAIFKTGPMANIVLEDLAKFCRAHEITFTADSRAHALLDGRREVWLRIQRHLNLSSEELWRLHNGKD